MACARSLKRMVSKVYSAKHPALSKSWPHQARFDGQADAMQKLTGHFRAISHHMLEVIAILQRLSGSIYESIQSLTYLASLI